MNHYPWWKNALLAALLVIGLIYAVPNLFGEDPAVQLYGSAGVPVDQQVLRQVTDVLSANGIAIKATEQEGRNLYIRVYSLDDQQRAQDLLQSQFGEDYTVSINLMPATPAWLQWLSADPVKLGLDLRGGVHFLLDVDVESIVKRRQEGDARTLGVELRQANIRYRSATVNNDNQIVLQLLNEEQRAEAGRIINTNFQEQQIVSSSGNTLVLEMRPDVLIQARQAVIEQTMITLRNRVNELGIAEASIQQQGTDRLQVDLPGVQDIARAKEILGSTATLEFRIHDDTRDVASVLRGEPSTTSRVYYFANGEPILLRNELALTGESITNANFIAFGETGGPEVQVRLGGGGEARFYRLTGDNVGKLMGIVYVETKVSTNIVDDEEVITRQRVERVISAPRINSALPNTFQITGLVDGNEARDLALILRSGALPAGLEVIQEKVIGPSLGADNIQRGMISLVVGTLLVILFMWAYYRGFGLIANVALVLNLIFILAILSLLGATLTFPGIAGIVLTMGMAVDANVLICERIREELRNGMSPLASINAGYDRAFSTIIDANLTTLIVSIVLFSIGTGAIKGFAVTLSIGILTSMITAVMYTRAIVNFYYGNRSHVKQLSIGIRV